MLFADLIPVLYAAAVAGLAMGVALLLRRAGAGATSLAAALLIGCMFGPTIAGRVAPGLFENIAMGGPDARLAVAQSNARALVESMRTRAQDARTVAPQREVVREESQSIRWLAITIGLFGLGVLSTRRATRPTARPGQCHDELLGAAWNLIVFGGGVVFILRASGIAGSSLLVHAWLAASMLACGVAASGHARANNSLQNTVTLGRMVAALGLIVVVAMSAHADRYVLMPAAIALACAVGFRIRLHAATSQRVAGLLACALLALMMLEVDLLLSARWSWLIVLAWVAAADGRWLLAALIVRQSDAQYNRGGVIRSMVHALPVIGGGAGMLFIAALGFSSGVFDRPIFLLLSFAAILVEFETALRPTFARQLASARRIASAAQ